MQNCELCCTARFFTRERLHVNFDILQGKCLNLSVIDIYYVMVDAAVDVSWRPCYCCENKNSETAFVQLRTCCDKFFL